MRRDEERHFADLRTIAVTPVRLGIVRGQVQHQSALQAAVPAARISEFATQEQAIEALLARHIDGYMSTALGNRTFVQRLGHPNLRALAFPVDPGGTSPVGGFSFARNQGPLRDRFDAFLAGYLGSAVHREAMARQGLSNLEIDPIAPLPRYPDLPHSSPRNPPLWCAHSRA